MKTMAVLASALFLFFAQLTQSYASLCPSHCETCDYVTNTTCLTCEDGYYVSNGFCAVDNDTDTSTGMESTIRTVIIVVCSLVGVMVLICCGCACAYLGVFAYCVNKADNDGTLKNMNFQASHMAAYPGSNYPNTQNPGYQNETNLTSQGARRDSHDVA